MEIKQLTIENISEYKGEIAEFVYESVKMSSHEDTYTRGQAEKKTQELYSYVKIKKAIALGAFDGTNLIGALWAYEYPFREDTNRLYISILHVKEGYRGNKIGSKLVNKMESIAKDSGYGGIFLHAEASNDGACRFYEKMQYMRERIQYVKKATNNIVSGGVLQGTAATIDEFRDQFVRLYFNNVKAHDNVEHFSIYDAEKKIEDFQEYIRKEKAFLFYVPCEDTVAGFMWVHPIDYKGNQRIYIHAISVRNQFKGKGIATNMYSFLLASDLCKYDVYTHVDASNVASLHFHEKMLFKAEQYQYFKQLA